MNTVHLSEPDEVMRELQSDDAEVRRSFEEEFSENIADFCKYFAESWSAFLSFQREVRNDKQRAYVACIIMSVLNNAFTSLKLFISGYSIPAGNLMRQAIESIAVALLCSSRTQIHLPGKKESIDYFHAHSMKDQRTKAHRALIVLGENIKMLGIEAKSVEILKKQQKSYHDSSHTSHLSLMNMVSLGKENDIYIGSSYDKAKEDFYRHEIISRVDFCKIIPNLIQGISENMRTP
ncbi:MAG TPA: hypothetical protein PLQ35_11580 [bacterium]|nr:hypothetical protein [bacterium]HQL62924.1 hypothetical protein [bacterium]